MPEIAAVHCDAAPLEFFGEGVRRKERGDFGDWAVPSPPLTLASTDESEGILFLRLD